MRNYFLNNKYPNECTFDAYTKLNHVSEKGIQLWIKRTNNIIITQKPNLKQQNNIYTQSLSA